MRSLLLCWENFFHFDEKNKKRGWKLKTLYFIRAQLLLEEKSCENRHVKHVRTDIKYNKNQYLGYYVGCLSCEFWFSSRSLFFKLYLLLSLQKNVTNIINLMKNRAYCSHSLFHPEGL